MKIGLDVRNVLIARTGIARYTTELAVELSRLARAGAALDLRLFADSMYPPVEAERAADLARRAGRPLSRVRVPGRLTELLGRFGWGVDLRLGGVDVFHLTDYSYPPIARARTVMTVHDVSFDLDATWHTRDFRERMLPRFERALSAATRVIVPAAETKRRLVETRGVPAEKIVVVPLGADHVAPDAPHENEAVESTLAALGVRAPFVLCVGTIEPRKNHLGLLAAFEKFAARAPHRLVIVGRYGWCSADVHAEIDAAVARGRVTYLEDVDDRALAALYRGAEFTAYPSLYEGFGLPVVEAFARGAPVVTSDRGALPDTAGGAALLVDPTDVDALASAFDRLASDAALRADLARRGRARAAELTWAKTAAATLDVYRAAATG